MVSKCFILTKHSLENISKFMVQKTSRTYLNEVITINIRNETHSVPPDKIKEYSTIYVVFLTKCIF